MDFSLVSFIKREQQPIFIGIVLFAAVSYPCHSFFAGIVRHASNQQEAKYPQQNMTCVAFIKPQGPIRAGAPAKLEIDEIWDICDRQPAVSAESGAIITKAHISSYQISFVPKQAGSLGFTFIGANGSSTSYNYNYQSDPPPIVAILLEVVVLCTVITLLIVFVRHQIRIGNEEIRKRADAVLEATIEVTAAETQTESTALFGVSEPAWLGPTVDALTQYGKLVASVTAIVYLAGIFVVNAYLSQWGASDYSLIKPRALLAGLWFLFFLALCVFPMRMFFGKVFYKPQAQRKNDGTVWFLLTAFGGGMLRLLGFFLALCFSAIPLTVLSGLVFMGKQGGGGNSTCKRLSMSSPSLSKRSSLALSSAKSFYNSFVAAWMLRQRKTWGRR